MMFDAYDLSGYTPLMLAASGGYCDCVSALVEYGANIRAIEKTCGDSVLHMAVKGGRGSDECVRILLQGAVRRRVVGTETSGSKTSGSSGILPLNNVNRQGQTPLLLAVSLGYDKVAETLLLAGVKVDISGPRGATPLHIACRSGSKKMCHVLLGGGADILCRDDRGRTPLYYAIVYGHIDTVKYILEASQPDSPSVSLLVTDVDGDGNSALHVAAEYARKSVVTHLLDIGVEPRVRNSFGESAARVATRSGHADIARLIRGAR
eukprot:gnl/Carplike_NY0171/6668_a9162_268.p1 GENE.gnl/Carplike_NY0171/6668_a9162_268~~gnl/Carplike_NY0171/6668_a9162_268.p1  ORF type:complete len:264 (-),score=73.81 gnl/Carplike_NY0171/6668_a9162_268:273-1064(-)